MTQPVRALVVDDSVVVRRTVATVLSEAADVDVIATASDGRLGLRRIAEARPDVVTLDIEMPGLDGLATLAQIRENWPDLPVIMYSTLTERGAHATFDALALGAVDYATKPSGAVDRAAAAAQVRSELLPLVRLWGRRRLATGRAAATGRPTVRTARPTANPSTGPAKQPALVAIGVSTGGPDALAALLPQLPADLPVPVVIVQHMPPMFTTILAERLDRVAALTVTEAVDGEPAEAGHVYLAPGGRHLEVHEGRDGLQLALSDAAPENYCRPAVDVLFRTAVGATGGALLAVVLTGMGQDGLAGARLIHAQGGAVLAQDEASSVVWGMPGFIAREGLATSVLPLGQMASEIARRAGHRPTRVPTPSGSLGSNR